MPDAIFAHPRLAPLYDAFDGGRDDLAAYLDIARELGADRVLDVGCGTGCLAVLLAESGRTVVGVDPAEASLEVARAKDAAGRITWVRGDATIVPSVGFDLAVMTGNVAQVFLTDAAWGVDVLVIATPDDAVADVAAAVTPHAETTVVHLSGSLGLSALEPQGTGEVEHRGVGLGRHGGGGRGHGVIGGGDDQNVDASSGAGEVVVTTEEADHVPAVCGERSRE